MSRHGTLLPIPEGSDLAVTLAAMIEQWVVYPDHDHWHGYGGRGLWLSDLERRLHKVYPQSSSADRKLTARHYAPFPLRDGPNVP